VNTLWLALGGAWNVLWLGMLLGAGLPAVFALGIRALSYGVGGDADATDHQPLFTSVKLKGFAHFELERNEGVRGFAFFAAPGTNEVGDLAIAARVTVDLYLRKQGFGGAPVLFGAVGTSL